MKTLKQLREEYDNSMPQIPEEILLEAKDKSLMGPIIPSPKEMPVMLLFRRISYRVFPNKQVVALYYSKMIDKYFSVPFGPTGNVNVNEARMIDEDWQKVNRRDKTDGLSQAAVNAYRRENPGSKLKTAVTEKNPTGKRASRRKSFCSRMGGMKKRLTSAKTARDPNSRINKALRRWNCEESFRQKLYEKRMQREGVADYLDAGAEAIVPYYSAGKKLYKGDYKGAATDAAVDTALLATGAVAGKVAGAGLRLAGKGLGKIASKFRKTPKVAPKPKATSPKTPKKSGGGAGADIARAAADAAVDMAKGAAKEPSRTYEPDIFKPPEPKTPGAKITSSLKPKMPRDSKSVNENKISDIRSMVESEDKLHEMTINGRTVTLNNSMAKRILEVYDSVNTKNKKIVEGMLNEDLESFKKLLNFSIKA